MPYDLVLLVAALAGWAAVNAAALALTRFGRPRRGPESPQPPDDLPPGVVAYLVGGPGAEPVAAGATLLDLAARGVVVLEEQGRDPAATTARPGSRPESLDRLEHLVLERVRTRGRGGPVPVSALAARAGERDDDEDALASAVVGAARARGLSRPRAGVVLRSLLVVAAAVPSAALGLVAALRSEDTSEPLRSATGVGLVGLVVLLLPTWRLFDGERLTRAGRRAAQAWRGHGTALGRDEVLRAARPAQALTWGRRLATAHALGLTRVVDRSVRLGPGDRRLIWSSRGGRWRQVAVRYPRGQFVGAGVPWTAVRGLWLAGVTAATVFALFWVPAVDGVDRDGALLSAVRAVGVVVLLAVGTWVLLRFLGGVLEIGAARTLTGEVLWIQEHRVNVTENGATVDAYHLVVDEGTSDRLTAWSLPPELRDRVATGDVVRVTVRPLSRRVTAVDRSDAEVREPQRPA